MTPTKKAPGAAKPTGATSLEARRPEGRTAGLTLQETGPVFGHITPGETTPVLVWAEPETVH